MKIEDKLGLGTVQFGLSYGISNKDGQTSEEEVVKILNKAKASNIEILDSASAYGSSEEVLGKNDISSFKVVSKFMPPRDGVSILNQFNQSLENLGLESLYGYLSHRPEDILNHPEQWQELLHLKKEGKVEKIGFSLNEPEELEQLLDKGLIPDLIQVPYNYFDRRFESQMMDLKEKGCEIHTRSSFLQGLFFMDPETLDEFFDEIKPELSEIQQKKPLNGALLKFVIGKPFIDKVIIGVENKTQLVQNIENIKQAPVLDNHINEISNHILIPSRWPKK